MVRPVLVADLFCGAGGSSTGARRALEELGLSMDLVAVNHWAVAVETHSRNHPEARHLCVDVYRTTPLEAVPGGRLDLLMASPTCTFYSRARGGKPISREQRFGRMTPTQVLRWLTDLDVACLLVENVPEFVDWGPVHRGPVLDEDGEELEPAPPLPERCAADGRCRPAKPCRRRRGYYFRPWVRKIEALGYRVEWRVLNAADYGDATTRQRFFLLARKDRKPITWPEPTHSRDGSADLFGGGTQRWRAAREIIDWSIPGRSIFGRKKPLSPKTLARIYAGAVKFGWPEPFLVVLRQHMDAQGLDRPLPTITAGGTHLGLAQPLVVRSGMHQSNALCVRDAGQPIPTVTTEGGIALAQPIIIPQRTHHRPRGVDEEPTPTITTTSRGIGLAQPFLVGNRTNNTGKAADTDPVPGITTSTGGGVALVLPQGGGGQARPVGQPVPTIATDGAVGLVVPYNRTAKAQPVSEPLPTLTTRDRCGMVVPVTHQDGSSRARSLEDPLPTITGAHRGELACIVAAFGERAGQAPRVHSVDEPAPTICARGRVQLVEGAAAAERVDILFRMLEPHELAAAMGFSDEDQAYEFAGTKEEITRQIGNAVPVRTSSALVGAIFAGHRARARKAALPA